MDATELGLQFFYLILVPGFFFVVGFRFTADIRSKGGDFGTVCTAAVMGVLLIITTQRNPQYYQMLLHNPLSGGVALAFVGLIIGSILGLPLGWLRSKLQ